MPTPLLALFLFAAWTVFMVVLVGFHRWKCVFTGTVPKGGFPSDIPPAEESCYRRTLQAHKNCVENLVVFGAIVLGLHALGLSSPVIDNLAIAVIVARFLQSLVHITQVQTRPVIMVRFTFFLVQVVAFAWLLFIAFTA